MRSFDQGSFLALCTVLPGGAALTGATKSIHDRGSLSVRERRPGQAKPPPGVDLACIIAHRPPRWRCAYRGYKTDTRPRLPVDSGTLAKKNLAVARFVLNSRPISDGHVRPGICVSYTPPARSRYAPVARMGRAGTASSPVPDARGK